MTDTFNVSASYDKASYNKGDAITATISGNDVLTNTVSGNSAPFSLSATMADGSTASIAMPAAAVNVTTTAPESVRITSVSDTSGRSWTIAANGLSVSAVA
jgi:hypothetical protein